MNFFESAESAARWAERQEGRRFRFLRVDVAFAWARDYISSTFRHRAADTPMADREEGEA